MIKKTAAIALLMILCMLLLPAQAEIRGYEKDQGYVYLQLGEYPYESDGAVQPVLWRVLDVQDNQALLLTEYIIDTDQVIFETDQKVIKKHSYRRIKSFEESDLFPKLSGEYLDRLLGEDPLRGALVQQENGAYIFLLTDEEFMNPEYGFAHARWAEWPRRIRSHEAQGTPYAVKQRGLYKDRKNGMSPYWVNAIKNEKDYKLQIVGYNGHLSYGAYTRVNIGLRLSLELDLNKVQITGGEGTEQAPYTLEYADAAQQAAD